jgi:hypothetical protein
MDFLLSRATNTCSVLMKSPLIANGSEIFRIEVLVKIEKSNDKNRRLGKMSIFLQNRIK